VSVAAIVVALAFLTLATWLRAAGTAMTRIPRADALRDSSEHVRGAEAVSRLLEEREAINPAVSVVAVALLVASAVLFTAVLVSGESLAADLGIALVIWLLVFLIGDLIPRQLGRRRTSIAYRSAAMLGFAIRLGGWANDLLPEPEPEEPVEQANGEEQEQADEQERELIDSVLEFGETLVREVMTPRPDMVTVPVTATIEEVVEIASAEGYSRVPITDDGEVVGVLIVKDLLPILSNGERQVSITEVMRPAEFVPETKLASALLAEMRSRRIHQAMVVDEYGDVVGLVTIEDLIEELVGEISDETDEDETYIEAIPDGRWDVDARVGVDELAEALGVSLPEADSDTVGGLMLDIAERIPAEGEEFEFGDLKFEVTGMQGRRVSRVRVSVSSPVDSR
jgi:CBS domain containing-hemolysin-like protein